MPDIWVVIVVLLIAASIGDWVTHRAEQREEVLRLVAGSSPSELPDAARDYLAKLDAHLRLPSSVRREIELELRDHFADSIAALEAEGLDRERAAREAIARLGRPDELGRQLRIAHQSNLRLLAGIGGGVFSAAGGVLFGLMVGYLFAFLALIVGGIAVAVTIGRYVPPLSDSDVAFGTLFACLVAYVPAVLAARRAVAASATISQRDPEQIARWWAVGGAAAIAALLLFVVTAQQSWFAVVGEATIALAFAAAALIRPSARIPRIRARIFVPVAVAFVVAPLVLMLMLTSGASTSLESFGGPLPQVSQNLDVVAPRIVDPEHAISGPGGWVGRSAMDLQMHVGDPAYYAGWTNLRLEAWRAEPPSGDHARDLLGVLDKRFRAPYTTVPIASITRDLVVHADLGHSRTTRWMIVVTGTGPDGDRYVLTPSVGTIESQFSGTVWDWLTASE